MFYDQGGKNNSQSSEEIGENASLRCAFELFDAQFFNGEKVTTYNLKFNCFVVALYISLFHVVEVFVCSHKIMQCFYLI